MAINGKIEGPPLFISIIELQLKIAKNGGQLNFRHPCLEDVLIFHARHEFACLNLTEKV